jgi:predicted Zn-dependent protease
LKYVLLSILILAISVGLLVLYYSKDILLYSLRNHEDSIESSKLFKVAEDSYRNGYLENSAVSYYNYLNTNPSRVNKILTYKRLFEINVLRGDVAAAFDILEQQEKLSPNDLSVNINRLKLLLREENLVDAKIFIDANYGKMKKSPEFIDWVATYYMMQENYERALKELERIPVRKRDYSFTKKIVHCYVKQNQLSKALSCLHKKEPLVRTFDDKAKTEEFFLLKNIVLLLKGESNDLCDDLRVALLEPKMRVFGAKLQILSCMLQERNAKLAELLEDKEIVEIYKADPVFLSKIGNYYAYTKDYEKARIFYEMIPNCRDYNEQELLALIDIYYRNGSFAQAEETLSKLNRRFAYKKPVYFKNGSLLSKKQGKFAEAVHKLKQGSELYSKDAENFDSDFYFRLAHLHGENGFAEAALKYLEEGKNLQKKQTGTYDKTFDILKIKYAGAELSHDGAEQELLERRERSDADLTTYFRLVRFYLESRRQFDAQRELDTVKSMPMSKQQRSVYDIYCLFLAMYQKNQASYQEVREKILDNEKSSPLYIALIHLLDGNYKVCLDTLVEWEGTLAETEKDELNQIYYLCAVANYLRNNVSEAYRALHKLPPEYPNAGYLKGLLQTSSNQK